MPRLRISSKRLASIAARGIRQPSKLKAEEVRALAASVLAQAKIVDVVIDNKPEGVVVEAFHPEPVEPQ